MPVANRFRRVICKVDIRNDPKKDPFVFNYTTGVTTPESLFQSTDTVRRKRPVDGFQSMTNRVTSSTICRDSGFNYIGYGGTYQFRGESIYGMYPGLKGPLTSDPVGNGSLIQPPPNGLGLSMEDLFNRIRAEVRGEAVNLANCLGEYRQTAALFHDFAKIVTSRGKSLLRKHPVHLRNKYGRYDYTKSAAEAYLQWQYGIKPLALDLGTAVAEMTTKISKPLYLEGVMRQRKVIDQGGFVSPSSSVLAVKADIQRKYEVHHRVQYRAYLNQGDVATSLAKHGLFNPAALAWELTPFSFVVDWWTNIGDVLQSLDNLILLDRIEAIISTSTRFAADVSVPFRKTSTYDGVTGPGGMFYYERNDTRSGLNNIARTSTLSYKPSVSYTHIANGLALLNGMYRLR